jgi:hypothetical protein
VALAREASFTSDIVEMENCYQHAEHYFRVMRTVRAPDDRGHLALVKETK